MNIGRLRDLRAETGLNQEEVAKKLGIGRTTYAMYEQGNREPDNDTLIEIAELFNVSIDYLLGRDVPRWANQSDILDLYKMLDSNVNMAYGGENLTEEEKQRVKDILTGIFWEKLEKIKKK
ncbi:helix-turn-helix domain-containing protein [Carnobacterium jeotgali]|uniref:helix-turn-helix domain-containing protein n=1 Tax=Carnobacterium jeotgali TaxID=545534 RepID=UPI00049307C3|nr:helix-turn-helix transcriptional regulator [Carnobacterium jeotgali]